MKKFLASCLFINMLGSSSMFSASADYDMLGDGDYSFVYCDSVVDQTGECTCSEGVSETSDSSRSVANKFVHNLIDVGWNLMSKVIYFVGTCVFVSSVYNYNETYNKAKVALKNKKKDFGKYLEKCASDDYGSVCSEFAHNVILSSKNEDESFVGAIKDCSLLVADYGYQKAKGCFSSFAKKFKSFFND